MCMVCRLRKTYTTLLAHSYILLLIKFVHICHFLFGCVLIESMRWDDVLVLFVFVEHKSPETIDAVFWNGKRGSERDNGEGKGEREIVTWGEERWTKLDEWVAGSSLFVGTRLWICILVCTWFLPLRHFSFYVTISVDFVRSWFNCGGAVAAAAAYRTPP